MAYGQREGSLLDACPEGIDIIHNEGKPQK